MKLTKQQIINELWSRGDLSYKCHAVQKQMYNIFYSSPKHSMLVWLLARQSGKSVLIAILALEQALREKNSVVKILTDTKLHAKNIFDPIFKMLVEDCPEKYKPKYLEKDFTYNFYNGSQIQLAGSDNGHYERLRGQKSNLILVDEAGFCDNLNHVVKSILFPTTTHTGGNIVLASTPSDIVEHEFHTFIEEAELRKTLTKKTLFDNPLLDDHAKQRIISEMGGVDSAQFRREYLCEILKNESNSAIPEFTEELEKEICKEWPKPPYSDFYVSMDLGGKDLTAVLFGYYDFRSDKVIIEDEIIMDFSKPDSSIKSLSDSILVKEEKLFTDALTHEKRKPLLRVSDINYIVINEILKYSDNQLSFTIPKKDDKMAAVNDLRILISSKKVIINPKCQILIRHLRNVKWDKERKKFGRSPDDGHYDAVDALIYMIRSVSFGKNPYPYGYKMELNNMFVPSNHKSSSYNETQAAKAFQAIFGAKRR
jgi:hypothetical protein